MTGSSLSSSLSLEELLPQAALLADAEGKGGDGEGEGGRGREGEREREG